MNVFYANIKFNNDILKSSVKGVDIDIKRKKWKDVVGLRQSGKQVRKGETIGVDEFNKVQYFNCVHNPSEQTHNFHVDRLRMEERLVAMMVTEIIMPRGNNHSSLNEGELVVMYCIQNEVVVHWIYTIHDHMMKEKGSHI